MPHPLYTQTDIWGNTLAICSSGPTYCVGVLSSRGRFLRLPQGQHASYAQAVQSLEQALHQRREGYYRCFPDEAP